MENQDRQLMRMKELCERSGISRTTVKYYIAKGLLPKPVKSSRNMAYYDQTHVNAIRTIKDLQAKSYFPLDVIKERFADRLGDMSAEELQVVAEIEGKVFKASESNERLGPFTRKQMQDYTGVSLKEIRDMEKHGIIKPSIKGGKEFFENDDIRLVASIGRIRSSGFTSELGFTSYFIKLYKETFDRLAEEETRIVIRNLSGKVSPAEIVKMSNPLMAEVNILSEILHRRSINATLVKYITRSNKHTK